MIKKEARIKALEIRKSINRNFSLDVLNKYIKDKKIIGIYYPINSEINLLPLIEQNKDNIFVFPFVKDGSMGFKYLDNKGFKKALFNTYETQGDVIDSHLIDMIIVPCLAVNNDGYRLGYGKGYYDKYLSNYKGEILTVIYKELILDFKEESHDAKMKEIIVI